MQADLELHRPRLVMKTQSALGEAMQIALQQFISRPVVNLLTMFVLAIVLVLPVGLFWLLINAPHALQNWQHSPKVALYLKADVTTAQAETLLQQIAQHKDVAKAVYISPEQGLKDLIAQTKVNVADKLPNNPLPGVIVILPKGVPSPHAITQFHQDFKAFSQVEQVQFNKNLMEQRYDNLQLTWQFFYFFSGLFIFIAVMIIALQLQLSFEGSFGALFCSGIFYGFGAGLLTWVLFAASLSNFAGFIQAWMDVSALSSNPMGKFLLVSTGLGLLGAGLANMLLFIHPIEPEQTVEELEAYPESEPVF